MLASFESCYFHGYSKMKHANRPLLNFRVCQVEMCFLDFEGTQCSVKSYANSHDGGMFFFNPNDICSAKFKCSVPFQFHEN